MFLALLTKSKTNHQKISVALLCVVIVFALSLSPVTVARAREGAKVPQRWWDQTGIDWEKAKAKGEETGMTDGTETGTDTEGEEEREDESRASGSSGAEWSGAIADEWT